MSKSKRTISIIVVVILALAAVVMIALRRTPAVPSPGGGATSTASGTAAGGSPTRAAISDNVAVPGKGATDVPANVAKPDVVGPAGPATSASYRGFSIKIEGNQFTPDTVVVRQGDTAHIDVTAVDKDYDFTQPDYGFKVPIPKGATKPIEFGATASGKFTFFCAACGGPAKGPVGYLVVAPKQ
jgi:heme/copper-type cytochrome/quinol oxidase subunit 2